MASSARRIERIAPAARMAALVYAGRAVPVLLRQVTGDGALAATGERPPVSGRIVLRHGQAGSIAAEVTAVERGGVRLRFDRGEASVAFALAVAALDFAERRVTSRSGPNRSC